MSIYQTIITSAIHPERDTFNHRVWTGEDGIRDLLSTVYGYTYNFPDGCVGADGITAHFINDGSTEFWSFGDEGLGEWLAANIVGNTIAVIAMGGKVWQSYKADGTWLYPGIKTTFSECDVRISFDPTDGYTLMLIYDGTIIGQTATGHCPLQKLMEIGETLVDASEHPDDIDWTGTVGLVWAWL